MNTKLFVFKSTEAFDDYRKKCNWQFRCSWFMDPCEPFEMLWDGQDYTLLKPSLELRNEFLMDDVYAFNDGTYMDMFLIPFEEVGSEVVSKIDTNEVLLEAVKELSMEVKNLTQIVQEIRFTVGNL